MGDHATDYDQYAPTYAWARSAVPWVLEPLARAVTNLPSASTVLEVGCGTGNYIGALAARRSDLAYLGFDVSRPMLRVARARAATVGLAQADGSRAFPYRGGLCALVFAVDVVHHLADLHRFFQESRRVLGAGGRMIIVTDSDDTMRARSLTKFFPEILEVERRRYPEPGQLHRTARAVGLVPTGEEPAVGDIPLSDDFVAALQAKCSSAMRLLPAATHAAGMTRVRAAQAVGGTWRSHYLVLHYAAPIHGA